MTIALGISLIVVAEWLLLFVIPRMPRNADHRHSGYTQFSKTVSNSGPRPPRTWRLAA